MGGQPEPPPAAGQRQASLAADATTDMAASLCNTTGSPSPYGLVSGPRMLRAASADAVQLYQHTTSWALGRWALGRWGPRPRRHRGYTITHTIELHV